MSAGKLREQMARTQPKDDLQLSLHPSGPNCRQRLNRRDADMCGIGIRMGTVAPQRRSDRPVPSLPPIQFWSRRRGGRIRVETCQDGITLPVVLFSQAKKANNTDARCRHDLRDADSSRGVLRDSVAKLIMSASLAARDWRVPCARYCVFLRHASFA